MSVTVTADELKRLGGWVVGRDIPPHTLPVDPKEVYDEISRAQYVLRWARYGDRRRRSPRWKLYRAVWRRYLEKLRQIVRARSLPPPPPKGAFLSVALGAVGLTVGGLLALPAIVVLAATAGAIHLMEKDRK